MLVLKFGGTSVANSDAILKIASILKDKNYPKNMLVVVSAMSGVTDMLINCFQKAAAHDESYQDVIQQLEVKHMDAIEQLVPINFQIDIKGRIKMILRELEDMSKGVYLLDEISDSIQARVIGYGEILSSAIVSVAFQYHDLPNVLIDSRDFILTDENYLNAKVDLKKSYNRIKEQLPKAKLIIAPGFVARSEKGKATVLGRGGSDYSASIYAAAMQAEMLEIWSDVDGMYTTDPRKAKSAYSIKELSYQEAMELAFFGAKVLYPPTIAPLVAAKIPLVLKNTFNPAHKGTLISDNPAPSKHVIKGVSCIDNIAMLTLSGSGMIGVPGIAMRMFKAVATENINIYFITQSSSEQSITIGLAESDGKKAVQALTSEFTDELASVDLDPLTLEAPMSIVALVGNGMIKQPGIAGTVFSILGKNNVNIRAIAQGATERNISIVVKADDSHKAVNLLHDSFFLPQNKNAAIAMA
ncbi:aspartate kinase [Pontibacter silvestris]|uniref:Aspartokinase n=1 Tax=Pontibacter silvestris TaxID=2305183 RepID=A0ABW4X1R2_9BACT|nr:aspartate kinase [Pontibacter silvestris]MCC9136023.1 aspartate kinase [Pontibacter silvestris]